MLYSCHCCSLFSARQMLCTSRHFPNFEPKTSPEEKPEKPWVGPDSHKMESSTQKNLCMHWPVHAYKPDARCVNPFLTLIAWGSWECDSAVNALLRKEAIWFLQRSYTSHASTRVHLTIPAEPTSSCSCFHTHIANYLPSSLKHEKNTCSAHWKAICRQRIWGHCLRIRGPSCSDLHCEGRRYPFAILRLNDDFSDGIQWKLCPSDSAHFSAAWPKCQKNDTGSHSACLCAVKCRSAGC